MPTNPNMVAIQTVTVGAGGASSIDFQNIPQTYTDLILKVSVRETSSNNSVCYFTFNNTTANRTEIKLQGNGSGASSSSTTDFQLIDNASSDTASTFSNAELYIPNYAGSTNKSVSSDSVAENNSSTAFMRLTAHLWSNTAAINRITITTISNIAQYSTATLYGVTSAGYGAKATGGIISQDANYYYHTFLASGTFAPTQSISADCLVIAGGGSGGAAHGNQAGAGGGAGGYQLFTSQSLTAQNYTITVGAGGAGVNTNNLSAGNSGSNSQFGSLTASVGGGRAGSFSTSPAVGGSGGGGANQANTTGAAGTSGQGNAGGNGSASANEGAGGGGGSGGSGSNASGANGGNGGVGKNSESTWATVTGTGVSGYYAGGGGGSRGANGTTGGTGGLGGASDATYNANGSNAIANTGSGSGGVLSSTYPSPSYTSGNGASGVVIVRYAK